MRQTGSIVTAGLLGLGLTLLGSQALAQTFRAGERVKASPLAMNSHWEDCTVVSMTPGGDVNVVCGPRNTEYLVQAKWVKRSGGAAPQVARPQVQEPQAPPAQRVAAPVRQSPAAQAAAGLCPNAPRSLVGRRPQEHGICRIGARVTDREGRTGTVIAGLDNGQCQVCFGDGSSRGYLTFMLTAAGGAGQSRKGGGGAPASGNFQCYGGAAGNMRITINGGRWNGFYAKTMPDGRVGLSKLPNGEPYYMICERR